MITLIPFEVIVYLVIILFFYFAFGTGGLVLSAVGLMVLASGWRR